MSQRYKQCNISNIFGSQRRVALGIETSLRAQLWVLLLFIIPIPLGCTCDRSDADDQVFQDGGRPDRFLPPAHLDDSAIGDALAIESASETGEEGGRPDQLLPPEQLDGSVIEDASKPTEDADSQREDPAEKERRMSLIGELCSLLEQYPCLNWNDLLSGHGISADQSVEQKINDCVAALEIEFHNLTPEPCKELWEASLRCQMQIDYACPCGDPLGPLCNAPYMNGWRTGDICLDDMLALSNCTIQNPSNRFSPSITGERATCTIDTDLNDPGDCKILCDDSTDLSLADRPDTIFFGAECEGPESGPVECRCTIREHLLRDLRREYLVYGSDCNEAAHALADGKCLEITDCCFIWVDEKGVERCGCTSELASTTIPYPGTEPRILTCQEVADSVGGRVVDLCPSFDPMPSTLIFDKIEFPQ